MDDRRGAQDVTISTFALVLVSLSLSAMAQVLLRMGMLTAEPLLSTFNFPEGFVRIARIAPLWGGLICYGLSMIPWLVVLSRLPVSVAYPLVSLGYVLTAILGWFLLGEGLTPWRWIGIGLICLGVFVISRTSGQSPV
jgi:multidrug transporter EmrE-like cation transporter